MRYDELPYRSFEGYLGLVVPTVLLEIVSVSRTSSGECSETDGTSVLIEDVYAARSSNMTPGVSETDEAER